MSRSASGHSRSSRSLAKDTRASRPPPGRNEWQNQVRKYRRANFLGTAADLVGAGTEPFDSVLALGNNLGLLASAERAGDMLAALGALLRPGGVIVGTCIDPYQTSDDVHLAYHERNRQRGRMPGQVTIRVRYRRLATSWFDLLWMSLPELGQIAGQAGWQIAEAAPGPVYSVVLTRI